MSVPINLKVSQYFMEVSPIHPSVLLSVWEFQYNLAIRNTITWQFVAYKNHTSSSFELADFHYLCIVVVSGVVSVLSVTVSCLVGIWKTNLAQMIFITLPHFSYMMRQYAESMCDPGQFVNNCQCHIIDSSFVKIHVLIQFLLLLFLLPLLWGLCVSFLQNAMWAKKRFNWYLSSDWVSFVFKIIGTWKDEGLFYLKVCPSLLSSANINKGK